MPAYVIGEIEVTDPATFDDYRKRVPSTIAQYGGKYLARGGKVEELEGDWSPKRMVVVEFPTMAQALKWYRSPEYAPLIKLRQKGANCRIILVQGLQDRVGG